MITELVLFGKKRCSDTGSAETDETVFLESFSGTVFFTKKREKPILPGRYLVLQSSFVTMKTLTADSAQADTKTVFRTVRKQRDTTRQASQASGHAVHQMNALYAAQTKTFKASRAVAHHLFRLKSGTVRFHPFRLFFCRKDNELVLR